VRGFNRWRSNRLRLHHEMGRASTTFGFNRGDIGLVGAKTTGGRTAKPPTSHRRCHQPLEHGSGHHDGRNCCGCRSWSLHAFSSLSEPRRTDRCGGRPDHGPDARLSGDGGFCVDWPVGRPQCHFAACRQPPKRVSVYRHADCHTPTTLGPVPRQTGRINGSGATAR
jgi:hypothetical protein